MTKIILLLLITFSIFADISYPSPSFNSPRETMNYFLKTMKGFKLGDQNALMLATKSLDEKIFLAEVRAIKLEDFAKKLSRILDKIEYIDISTIPTELKEVTWYFKKEILTINNRQYDVEISITKDLETKQWKFSGRTYESLDIYESAYLNRDFIKDIVVSSDLKDRIIRQLPKWSYEKKFILKTYQWMALFLIILFSYIIDRTVKFYIAMKMIQYLSRKNIDFTAKEEKRITYPFGLLSFALVFKFLISKLELTQSLLSPILKLSDIVIAVSLVLTLVSLVDIVCIFLERKAKTTENKFDDILVPLIKKTSKFFIYAFGLIYIGDSLAMNMKNILAGMGIGGIAFALAAKDTVANLFGSFTVLIDRPFSIGDWIVINDSIKGTVEEVGLRSTRIRTSNDSLITVPNGNLTSAYIDNFGKRKYRRFQIDLGIDYDTPASNIENFCETLRHLIVSHPHTRKDNFHVYFTNMGASALTIYVSVFWDVPDLASELNEKHNLLLDIMRIAKKMNINFAFPTQTLHMLNDQKPSYETSSVNDENSKMLISLLANERSLREKHRSTVERL